VTRQLVRGGVVLATGAPRGQRADVVLEAGRIADVIVDDAPRPCDAEVVDAVGCAVIPGLINGHMHAHANLAKGLGDRWTLEMSLTHAPWVSGRRDLDQIYLSAAMGAAEMLLKGCTACYDMVLEFPTPTADGLDAVARAYDDLGIRAVLAPLVADVAFFDAIPGLGEALGPAADAPTTEALLANLRARLHAWERSADRLKLALGPTIPLLCSDAFLTGCRDLARDFDTGLHTHLCESKVQAVAAQRRYGATLPARLAELGLLSPSLTAAHAVWLNDDDRARLADGGVTVVHNPGSNFRLGSGVADIPSLARGGVVIGLGTDGATCADSLNMFEAMRLATHASRVRGTVPETWLGARDALTAATTGSARALGLDADLGRIAKGAAADLVLLDLQRPHYVPLNDLAAQIVYGEDSSGVRDVCVAGWWVVRDRELTTVDYPALVARAQAAADAWQARNADARVAAERLAPVAAAYCHGLVTAPTPVAHYVGHGAGGEGAS